MQLTDIGTKNISEFNPWLEYDLVIIDNWKNTCQRGMTGYIIVWRIMCSELLNCIEFMNQINKFQMLYEIIITTRTLKPVL